MSSQQIPTDSLVAALADIERYVTKSGWDQPARLFALVSTAQLLEAEPDLANHLHETSPDALSAIEQEQFHAGDDIVATLARIGWPEPVVGCALALERTFLPWNSNPRFQPIRRKRRSLSRNTHNGRTFGWWWAPCAQGQRMGWPASFHNPTNCWGRLIWYPASRPRC